MLLVHTKRAIKNTMILIIPKDLIVSLSGNGYLHRRRMCRKNASPKILSEENYVHQKMFLVGGMMSEGEGWLVVGQAIN
jgi:hypothetical protein